MTHMRSITEQRNVEIRQGFSPKPATVAALETGVSPSNEPETQSPSALLDGPLVGRALSQPQSSAGIVVQDGIVSFGK